MSSPGICYLTPLEQYEGYVRFLLQADGQAKRRSVEYEVERRT